MIISNSLNLIYLLIFLIILSKFYSFNLSLENGILFEDLIDSYIHRYILIFGTFYIISSYIKKFHLISYWSSNTRRILKVSR